MTDGPLDETWDAWTARIALTYSPELRPGGVASVRIQSGTIVAPSAYFMKSPPVQFSDEAAHDMVEEFILGNGASKSADWTAFFDAQPA